MESVLYALRWPVLRKSMALSLCVGSILTAINQGDVLLAGPRPPRLWAKVAFNFLIPLLVSSAGAAASRCRREEPR